TNSAASYRLRGNRLLAELVYWRKLLLAISADMTPSAAAKKRRFCRLRPRGRLRRACPAISADMTPSAAAKKRRFCRLRPRGAPSTRMPGVSGDSVQVGGRYSTRRAARAVSRSEEHTSELQS